MTEIRECRRCGKPFAVGVQHTIYCSRSCNIRSIRSGERLKGTQRGALLVIKKTFYRNAHGYFWRVRCACGKELLVERSTLVNNPPLVCTCEKEELYVSTSFSERFLEDINARRIAWWPAAGPGATQGFEWAIMRDDGKRMMVFRYPRPADGGYYYFRYDTGPKFWTRLRTTARELIQQGVTTLST